MQDAACLQPLYLKKQNLEGNLLSLAGINLIFMHMPEAV